MRSQYSRDITDQGTDIARQMSFRIEQGQDSVLSKSHRTYREAHISQMEVYAGKLLSKSPLDKSFNKGKGGHSDSSGSGPTLHVHRHACYEYVHNRSDGGEK